MLMFRADKGGTSRQGHTACGESACKVCGIVLGMFVTDLERGCSKLVAATDQVTPAEVSRCDISAPAMPARFRGASVFVVEWQELGGKKLRVIARKPASHVRDRMMRALGF